MINLRENEGVLKTVRQHSSVMFGAIAWPAALASFVFWAFMKFDIDAFDYSREAVIGVVLLATLIILYNIYVWRKNVLIITNQRIILNSRPGMFSRTVTELLYQDIYELSFEQIGLLPMLNRYGRLIIKTPSGSETAFDKVPSPVEVVKTINEIRVKKKEDGDKF